MKLCLAFLALLALPVLGSPIAAPAFVDVVTFKVVSVGDKQEVSVVSAPGLVRVDSPDDRLSVLYDPATEHYTGLEHTNYTYWEFTWPEVRAAVQNTARYATRLRDLGPELLEENAIYPTSTNAGAAPPTDTSDTPATDTAGGDTDNSGYVWHTDIARKRIADIDCVHWIGETVAGEKLDAWCSPHVIPEVDQALATLKEMNEPMALVPVRTLVPPLIFVAWEALHKAGVSPVQLSWGSDTEFNQMTLVSVKHRDGRVSDFQVPKLYMKTTLVTMDGIGNQRAQGTHRQPQDLPPTPTSPLNTP
jgi:hypothetical protein